MSSGPAHKIWLVVKQTRLQISFHLPPSGPRGDGSGASGASWEAKPLRAILFWLTDSKATTQPHLRHVPLRIQPGSGNGHYKKLVQAVMLSRATPSQENLDIHEGDIFVMGDGGRHGNFTALMSAFVDNESKALSKAVKTIYVQYNEDDVSKRRDLVRGNLSLDVTENFHAVARTPVGVVKRKRLHMENATTAGTGPLHNLYHPYFFRRVMLHWGVDACRFQPERFHMRFNISLIRMRL